MYQIILTFIMLCELLSPLAALGASDVVTKTRFFEEFDPDGASFWTPKSVQVMPAIVPERVLTAAEKLNDLEASQKNERGGTLQPNGPMEFQYLHDRLAGARFAAGLPRAKGKKFRAKEKMFRYLRESDAVITEFKDRLKELIQKQEVEEPLPMLEAGPEVEEQAQAEATKDMEEEKVLKSEETQVAIPQTTTIALRKRRARHRTEAAILVSEQGTPATNLRETPIKKRYGKSSRLIRKTHPKTRAQLKGEILKQNRKDLERKGLFIIEKLLKRRVKKDGTVEVLVKWYGHPKPDWQPEEHFLSSQVDLL